MKKMNLIFAFAGMLFLSSCETLDVKSILDMGSSQGPGTEKIIAGLKQALDLGTGNAVQQLSKKGGFSKVSIYHIAMPKELKEVSDTLKSIGLGALVNNFESKMNKAAEHASSSAGPVFLDAIKDMKFSDAKKILDGPDTAATDYFKKTTSARLKEIYKPIIKKNMNEVGVVSIYNDIMSKYDAIPFKSKPEFSLENYITDKALNAMFSVVAEEEKKIRQNPSARTTELLRQVFGN